jgi:hypothetical protein
VNVNIDKSGGEHCSAQINVPSLRRDGAVGLAPNLKDAIVFDDDERVLDYVERTEEAVCGES